MIIMTVVKISHQRLKERTGEFNDTQGRCWPKNDVRETVVKFSFINSHVFSLRFS